MDFSLSTDYDQWTCGASPIFTALCGFSQINSGDVMQADFLPFDVIRVVSNVEFSELIHSASSP